MNDRPARWLTRAETAEVLGVRPKTVSDYVANGWLEVERGPRRLYFRPEAIERFLSRWDPETGAYREACG